MNPRQSGFNIPRITRFIHRNLISFNETVTFWYKAVHFNFWMNTTHDWAGNETFAFYDSKSQRSMLRTFLKMLSHFTSTHTVDSQRAFLLIWSHSNVDKQKALWNSCQCPWTFLSCNWREFWRVKIARSTFYILVSYLLVSYKNLKKKKKFLHSLTIIHIVICDVSRGFISTVWFHGTV